MGPPTAEATTTAEKELIACCEEKELIAGTQHARWDKIQMQFLSPPPTVPPALPVHHVPIVGGVNAGDEPPLPR